MRVFWFFYTFFYDLFYTYNNGVKHSSHLFRINVVDKRSLLISWLKTSIYIILKLQFNTLRAFRCHYIFFYDSFYTYNNKEMKHSSHLFRIHLVGKTSSLTSWLKTSIKSKSKHPTLRRYTKLFSIGGVRKGRVNHSCVVSLTKGVIILGIFANC